MNSPNAARSVVLWSGGKDSCLALFRARKLGLQVEGLINFYDETTGRVRFHALRSGLIEEQARALRMLLFQYPTSVDSFTEAFDHALLHVKANGFSTVVAGDIHLREVRQWNEDRVLKRDLELIEPLWHSDGVELLREFVAAGFRAVITCCSERWINLCWPGRLLDESFIDEASANPEFDINGENGEYHSFVFDGPCFSQSIHWSPGEIRTSLGFHQLDVVEC